MRFMGTWALSLCPAQWSGVSHRTFYPVPSFRSGSTAGSVRSLVGNAGGASRPRPVRLGVEKRKEDATLTRSYPKNARRDPP